MINLNNSLLYQAFTAAVFRNTSYKLISLITVVVFTLKKVNEVLKSRLLVILLVNYTFDDVLQV